ncbi:MAG: Holliday junction branch migration protein RuvA, partial [Sporomusa sp.]
VILELKDKIGVGDQLETGISGQSLAASHLPGDIMQEAMQALAALGYNHAEIMPVIKKIVERESRAQTELSLEQLIRLTLKEFGRR